MSGPQDCHYGVAWHVLWAGRDGAQLSEAGPHRGRTAQQLVLGGVCFSPADRAESCEVALVLAPLAGFGGGLSNPMSPLDRAGSQLVDVDYRRSVSFGDRTGEARAHQPSVPSGRPGLDGTGPR